MKIELTEREQTIVDYFSFDVQNLVSTQIASLGKQMDIDLMQKTYEAVQADEGLKSAVQNKIDQMVTEEALEI